MPILIFSISFLYGLTFIMWLESWLYISKELKQWRNANRKVLSHILGFLLGLCIVLITLTLIKSLPLSILFTSVFFFILGIFISHNFRIFRIGPEIE